MGIKLNLIINQDVHRKDISEIRLPSKPSKYPPMYRMDVIIDDSLGVVEEGKRFHFDVIHISPDEVNFEKCLLGKFKEFEQSKAD